MTQSHFHPYDTSWLQPPVLNLETKCYEHLDPVPRPAGYYLVELLGTRVPDPDPSCRPGGPGRLLGLQCACASASPEGTTDR